MFLSPRGPTHRQEQNNDAWGARWRLRGDVSEPCRAHSACPGASLQLQAWPTTNYNGIDEARGVPVFT